MKKNTIICIMAALLVLTTYKALYYYNESTEYLNMYWDLKNKPLLDYIEKEKEEREARKTIPYNYLCESDINKNTIFSYGSDAKNMFPKNGVTRIMAARIAESIWYSQFGDKIILCRPYSVLLHEGKWVIAANHAEDPVGSAYMEIDQNDGRIIRYILGK